MIFPAIGMHVRAQPKQEQGKRLWHILCDSITNIVNMNAILNSQLKIFEMKIKLPSMLKHVGKVWHMYICIIKEGNPDLMWHI